MSDEDAFTKSVEVSLSDDLVRIKTRQGSALKLILYAGGLSLIGVIILIEGVSLGSLFLLAVFGVVAYLAYQEVKMSLYPLTILDLKRKSVVKQPLFGFLQAREYRFDRLKGVSMNIQAIGGYTSAYEDETTDYEKTLILETDAGDVPLFNFVSRVEEAEESLARFVDALRERLSQASVS